MPYLIDGNNLCGAARDRRLGLPPGEHEMVRTLALFAGRRRAALTVVFDGRASPRRGAGLAPGLGRVRILHSGAGRSADDAIVDLIQRHRHPKDLILVSSDRALAARARGLGSRVIGCREFAGLIARAAASGPGPGDAEEKPSPGDIEAWERYFEGRE